MSWKDIIVFADGSKNGVARAQMAGKLAREQGARLEICVPAVIPAPAYGDSAPVVAEMADEALKLAQDDAGRALAAAREAAPELDVSAQAPETLVSSASRLAGALGRAADLVIVGQPIASDASRLDDMLFEGALFAAGRPCLMLPRWEAPKPWGRRVLAPWKGAREAARAVHDALPLLAAAQSVLLFRAGAGLEREGEGPLGVARLASHLARHGVKVEEPLVEARGGGGDVGQSILCAAQDFDADLVVMGGYGTSRLRELVFGGATRTLLHSSPIPVLFSH